MYRTWEFSLTNWKQDDQRETCYITIHRFDNGTVLVADIENNGGGRSAVRSIRFNSLTDWPKTQEGEAERYNKEVHGLILDALTADNKMDLCDAVLYLQDEGKYLNTLKPRNFLFEDGWNWDEHKA